MAATWRQIAPGRFATRTTNGFILLVVRIPDGRWALIRPIPEEIGEDIDLRELLETGDRQDLEPYRAVLRPLWIWPEGVTPDPADLEGCVEAVEDGLKLAQRWRRYSVAVGDRLDAFVRSRGLFDPDEKWGAR